MTLLDEIGSTVSEWRPRKTWLQKLPPAIQADVEAAKKSYKAGDYGVGCRVVATAISKALLKRGYAVSVATIKQWLLTN